MRTKWEEGTRTASGQHSTPRPATSIAHRVLSAACGTFASRTASAIEPHFAPSASLLGLPSPRFPVPCTCAEARHLAPQYASHARPRSSRAWRTVAASASSLASGDLTCCSFPFRQAELDFEKRETGSRSLVWTKRIAPPPSQSSLCADRMAACGVCATRSFPKDL